ncbi:hypothetical protein AB0D99_01360 [Streptomyces sp. NPDC047971]|uniref:hypothetical protein n=1 Tax=Streptomyces sp. NPDC047971 TaxID=3154499 RepID=UPI003407CD9E
MSTEACGTTRHVPLEGYSRRARTWQKASWSRVLREATVGSLIMLIPALLLGFFISWKIGIAVIGATAATATLASVFFGLRGHGFGCSLKKGIVLALGWWERV